MNNTYEVFISIVIPTYKPQDYIFDCFESIDNQCFEKEYYEVIIVLNGDYEPYYSFIEEKLLQCEFNFRLFYTAVEGVSNARNIGIEQSKGKYLAFIDDDDMISENYLRKLYQIANNNKTPLSYMMAFTKKIANIKNYYITNVYEKMASKTLTVFNVRSYFSVPYCKLVTREMIGGYRFDPSFKNSEDSLFMFAISEKKMKLQFTDRTAIYYRRIRDNSATTRKITLLRRIENCYKLIYATILIYLRLPRRYNFFFFVSRVLAYMRSVIIR